MIHKPPIAFGGLIVGTGYLCASRVNGEKWATVLDKPNAEAFECKLALWMENKYGAGRLIREANGYVWEFM